MPRPTMHPVESSNVASIGHDGMDMHVAYKSGGIYVYKNVPVSTFREAQAAKSVGGFIHASVRGKHEVVMVDRGTSALPDDYHLSLLIEWRDAREAIFKTEKPSPEMFTRISVAEFALMTFARSLPRPA